MAASAAQQFTHEQLHELLAAERRRSAQLVDDLKRAKEENFLAQQRAEQEEEFITNRLTKRLTQLKREKQNLANEVEQEEEYLVNNLQKRLTEVTREKIDLERRLEAEQEYIVNKLQAKLQELGRERNKLNLEKAELENTLEAEQEFIANRLQMQVERLAAEKRNLQKEKSDMQRQVIELAAAVHQLNQDKCQLENQMEMEEEKVVNRLQRQLEGLLANYHLLEQRLEMAGVPVQQLPVAPMAADTEWVYSSGRRQSRGGRERSLSVSSGGSRRSSINELRLQRTSSNAMASTQPSQ